MKTKRDDEMALLLMWGSVVAAVLIALFAGCNTSNPTFAVDGARIPVDGDVPTTDADPMPSVDLLSAHDLLSSSDLLSPTDGGTADDLAPAVGDLMPAPSDLACLPFSPGASQPMACSPGQEQNTKTGPSMCFRKTCGCMNQATCTDCYWSLWTPVGCPP